MSQRATHKPQFGEYFSCCAFYSFVRGFLKSTVAETYMLRLTLAILLGIPALQSLGTQDSARPATSSSVSVSLPMNLDSEAVQIAYFMTGPFGGYGGYTTPVPGLHSYEIAASVDGKAATQIRIIAYAPGCEIQTFIFPVDEDSTLKGEFNCQPVPSVTLSGRIVPNELVRDRNTELVITYMAFWAYQFFGIVDGPVTKFRLATVSPDENGMFQVDLPDFTVGRPTSSSRENGSLYLMLRDAKTWNQIGSDLEPEELDFRSKHQGLIIRSFYSSGLNFHPALHL